eukprot:UN12841
MRFKEKVTALQHEYDEQQNQRQILQREITNLKSALVQKEDDYYQSMDGLKRKSKR